MYLCIHRSIYTSIDVSIHPLVYLYIHWSIYTSIDLLLSIRISLSHVHVGFRYWTRYLFVLFYWMARLWYVVILLCLIDLCIIFGVISITYIIFVFTYATFASCYITIITWSPGYSNLHLKICYWTPLIKNTPQITSRTPLGHIRNALRSHQGHL